ncbi:calcium-dependent protein kinase CDPK6, partial [Toxoplasma gondii ARI]
RSTIYIYICVQRCQHAFWRVLCFCRVGGGGRSAVGHQPYSSIDRRRRLWQRFLHRISRCMLLLARDRAERCLDSLSKDRQRWRWADFCSRILRLGARPRQQAHPRGRVASDGGADGQRRRRPDRLGRVRRVYAPRL